MAMLPFKLKDVINKLPKGVSLAYGQVDDDFVLESDGGLAESSKELIELMRKNGRMLVYSNVVITPDGKIKKEMRFEPCGRFQET